MSKTKEILNNLDFKIKENDAHNIRENSESISRLSTKEIIITPKKYKSGIDITIKKNTKEKSLFIPVIITKENVNEKVYNDFYIEDNVDVVIYAGCAIHNDCDIKSTHEGIHTFNIGKNSTVKYIEKHSGYGKNNNNKIINTDTIINIKDNSEFVMETIQNKGVDKAHRYTNVELNKNSKVIIEEKLLTENKEEVKTIFNVNLNKSNSRLSIHSRAVATESSIQEFISNVYGNNKCYAHVECDAIIMDKAKVTSTPSVIANHCEATLTHEAAIGKIAKEQIMKLMTLGLTKKEAEEKIINSFIN